MTPLKRHFPLKMAATLCWKLLPKQGWLPLTQTVRHGSKAVTRHRKPMHIIKQKLMAVTAYIPPKRAIPPGAYPPPVKQEQKQDNGRLLLLTREVKKIFQDCKMIAVVQSNATSAEDMMILKHRLYKHDIIVKLISNQVMRLFLVDSIYRNMAPLFIGPTVLIVSKEPKVKEMLVTLRGSPQMVLLGACIENTLLSAEGVVGYSKLPSLTMVQGGLVSGLTMLTSQTAFMLQHQPAHLSALLQQYLKQQSPEASTDETPKIEGAS
ncbi:39S ribosomal protein L10, mitochondrial [Lampris incognitus]|uniref:39S ribosomal protein L10, mitochondrial n=1 Tax=Lampris incognitus TaxID=2546036 RepID=UPI0024B55620|nr:39S ribosomal protein L10, mitochondrial [Lampris incognitus]